MWFLVRKYLSPFFLFLLASCALPTPENSTDNSKTSPLPAYPLSLLYPGQVQTPAQVSEPALLSTLTPSSAFSPLPSPIVSPTEQRIESQQIMLLKMFDESIGWAAYSSWVPAILPLRGAVYRTTDSLQTWSDITPPISKNSSNLRAAFFVDSDTAVAISNQSFLPESAKVEITPWRSTTAGQDWRAGEIIQIDAPGFLLQQLEFIDADHGWLLGASDSGMNNMRVNLFETRDGGMHWRIVYDTRDHISDLDTLWIKGYYPYLERFAFASDTVGYFSDGRLFASQDGGESWQSHPLVPPADLPELDCQGGNCSYLSSISSPRFTSAQDGVLISRAYLNSEVALDVFVYYPNTPNRLPLPTAQFLYFTNDGGNSWIPKSSPVRIGTIYFLDADKGWLLGKSDLDPAAPTHLYQTTDAGDTWNQISANSMLPLGIELQFVDEQTGYAYYPFGVMDYYRDFDNRVVGAAQNSHMYVTKDGGQSWERVEPQVAQ